LKSGKFVIEQAVGIDVDVLTRVKRRNNRDLRRQRLLELLWLRYLLLKT
jgi:hypothetical protein